jgi:hypothetical protein
MARGTGLVDNRTFAMAFGTRGNLLKADATSFLGVHQISTAFALFALSRFGPSFGSRTLTSCTGCRAAQGDNLFASLRNALERNRKFYVDILPSLRPWLKAERIAENATRTTEPKTQAAKNILEIDPTE